MEEKCFCHLNGRAVKDATARASIKEINEHIAEIERDVYAATTENFMEIIANANPGSIVNLSPGSYPTLVLSGPNAYPENLTITGGAGVSVDGISITSGDANDNLTWVSDLVNVTIPGNLTFQGLTLTKGFSLRNGYIDGLKIIDCHITSGGINITPNAFADKFGKDGTGSTANRFSFQGATAKNVIIKGCTIDNVSKENNHTNHAIYFQTGENITIQSNTITANNGNGIQIVGMENRPVFGNIRICDNKILKSIESCVRISNMKNAYIFMVQNKFYECSLSGGVDYYINISECENTFCRFNRRDADGYNYYDTTKLNIGEGISVKYKVTCLESGEWAEWTDPNSENLSEGTYSKLSTGVGGCSCKFTYSENGLLSESEKHNGYYKIAGYIMLPFTFAEIPSVTMTMESEICEFMEITEVRKDRVFFSAFTKFTRDASASFNISVVGVWM